jgi:hypothetical protein
LLPRKAHLTSAAITALLLLLSSCTGAPLPAPGSSVPTAIIAPASAPPPPVESAPPPAPPARPALVVETVINEDNLGAAENGVVMARIDEGILVVRNLPVAAFLVSKEGVVKPLPELFQGLHSPEKTWGPLEFSVTGIHGSLGDLAFTMYAPATGQERDVRGRVGAWKVTKGTPKQPIWVSPEVIAPPITTRSGARLYEVAPEYQAEARRGFRFAFEGPAKGEKLPVPAPGKNGCKYRLLGHPFLSFLADGALLGVGTECASGTDYLATGKLDGVGWPYQTLLPRLGHGHLAVERWKDGVSTVDLLPGGDPVADFPGLMISVGPGSEVAVISQVAIGGDSRAYVALFDGSTWSDATPPHAPEWLSPYRSRKGTLHLFDIAGSFRRSGSSWDAIRVETDAKDDRCKEEALTDFLEPESGSAIFVRGVSGCLWRLPAGASIAERVRLPLASDAGLGGLIELGGWLYILSDHGTKGTLIRMRL